MVGTVKANTPAQRSHADKGEPSTSKIRSGTSCALELGRARGVDVDCRGVDREME